MKEFMRTQDEENERLSELISGNQVFNYRQNNIVNMCLTKLKSPSSSTWICVMSHMRLREVTCQAWCQPAF